MKNLIIASTSTIYGGGYLEYLLPTLSELYKGVNEVVFIPYARPSGITYDEYTSIVKNALAEINIKVKGIHEFDNTIEAIENAKGLFVGGGNTFVLVNELYQQNLINPLKEVIEKGTPYLGTSAGSNICGSTMQTTNDMPIVYPPNFKTLEIIPFNINAHYLDPNPNSKHKGETREIRIKEFQVYNDIPVIGLREGSWIEVKNNAVKLKGSLTARLFLKDKKPVELNPETELSKLSSL